VDWYTEILYWSAVIYPSLLQLEKGVTDAEDKKQKVVCMERYRKRDDEEHKQSSDIDIEREEECGICMEMNSKIVLPNCNHAMCLKCYHEWYFLSFFLSFTHTFISLLSWLVGIKKYKVVALFLLSLHLDSLYFFSSISYDLFLFGFANFIPYI
jgi:hypothetical protein